jgi:hypothetical protein
LLKCYYSDNRNLLTVIEAGGLAPYNLIQPTISLEMPLPSQGHCGFPSFPVVDWFCVFVDLWVLTFHLEDCSMFGNFVITLIVHLELMSYACRTTPLKQSERMKAKMIKNYLCVCSLLDTPLSPAPTSLYFCLSITYTVCCVSFT